MSHAATNWAIQQRGLKPTTKLVLWHLCDRHHADHGCFPSQDTLASDCELSRSALNRHLDELERLGLIRREQRQDRTTKRQQSTLYFFAFETAAKTQDVVVPCPETKHGTVSRKAQEPCPENGESRVRNQDTNLVKEPVIEPQGAQAREGEGSFNRLWEAWPERSRPDSREAAAAIFGKLAPAEQVLAVDIAKTFLRRCAIRKKPAHLIAYLKQRKFEELYDAPPLDKDGDFIITPDRPEWGKWLGAIRTQFGEPGIASVTLHRKYVTKTRWPETVGS